MTIASKLPPVTFTGSVKDIRQDVNENGSGIGNGTMVFEYSDRYSIFDWGEMPDKLEEKGKALAAMGDLLFKLLGQAGFEHHSLGMVTEDMKPILKNGVSNLLAVHPVDVLRPVSSNDNGTLKWDYSTYQSRPVNTIVPLEVIFRFGVPEGSSLLKRTGDLNYCQQLGLAAFPNEGDRFQQPIVEFSTKLESYDRYLKYDQAKDIAGLSDSEFEKFKEMTKRVALELKKIFAGIGIELLDGKFEFAFSDGTDQQGDRNFMLIDSIGPDELRLSFSGVSLSKENLRLQYKNSAWKKGVAEAKELADTRGSQDWKKICIDQLGQVPANLPQEIISTFSMMYKSIAECLSLKYTGRKLFEDAWNLEKVVSKITELEVK